MFQLKNTKRKVKTGFSQQHTKRNNTMLLFNLIRRRAPISRIMLAELTGLSATTVSLLVEDLLDNGLIVETGAAETNMRGRKPIMLEINGKGGYFVIVELRSKGFICSLYDLNAQKIALQKYNREQIIREKISLCQAIDKLVKENDIACENLIGINITYPGIVESANKTIISSTVLDISDYVTQEDIEQLKKEWADSLFLVTNTSVVSAYSEYILNQGIADSTIIEITMNEGIGAGVVLVDENGECMHYYVMEIGHMVIERGGKQCKCGNRGCFEALCGAANLIKRVNEEAGLHLEYDEEFGAEINSDAMREIRKAAEQGNEKVIAIVDDMANMLETVIINIVNMVNAEYVFLGGVVMDLISESGIGAIRKNVNRLHVKKDRGDCAIQASKLDRDRTRSGAVYMIMDEVFTVSQQE